MRDAPGGIDRGVAVPRTRRVGPMPAVRLPGVRGYRDAYGDRYRHADEYAHANAHQYAHANLHTDDTGSTHLDADRHGDDHADTLRDTDPDRDRDALALALAQRDAFRLAIFDHYRHAHGDGDVDGDADGDARAIRYANGLIHADHAGCANGHADKHSHADGDTHRDADAATGLLHLFGTARLAVYPVRSRML